MATPTPVLAPLEKRDDRAIIVHVSNVCSMVAGMVNMYAFYEVGVLLSHQTGNSCHIGRSVEASLFLKLMVAFIAFGVGCMVAAWAKWDLESFLVSRRSLGLFIAGVCVFLAVMMQWATEQQEAFVGSRFSALIQWHIEDEMTASIALLGFSQGLQNAITSTCKAMPVRTTHITGSLTDAGMAVGVWLRAKLDSKTASPNPWKPSLLVLSMIFFFLGGFILKQLIDTIGVLSGLVPAVLLMVSALGGLLGPLHVCRRKQETHSN